ncbi:class I SAM-dependent methyltransferase [Clostridium estertheticum]|uniref:class I SAM-dependent methyltransferase n=1 Tax=Clostridium estertheticum TaxID=238834 RepID=UPI001C7DE443|nr:class I SAM-dependent methyltransferase [Clostridium estertheticum]MBX4264173.1 class I SAM-dependent methyltransferase [Clostridium estertheticum]WLC89032.1 class I SAM-dependent methyltransferase [Clostridium estertheticum]
MDNDKNSEMQGKVTRANVDFYAEYAKKYEVIEESVFCEENTSRVHDLIKGFSEKYGNDKLLDVGCGTGNILRFAIKYFKHVTGFDVSQEMLEISKKYTNNLVLGDATNLPFADNSFNVVTSYSVLHHLYDPLPVIKEMYRVCKKGGIVYTDNDPNGFYEKRFKWYKDLRKKFYKKRMDKYTTEGDELTKKKMLAEYHHYYTQGLDTMSIKKMFENVGFQDVKLIYRFHPRPNLFAKVTKVLLFLEKPERKCPFIMIIARK